MPPTAVVGKCKATCTPLLHKYYGFLFNFGGECDHTVGRAALVACPVVLTISTASLEVEHVLLGMLHAQAKWQGRI